MNAAADCDRCKRIWERPKFDRKFFGLAAALAVGWAATIPIFSWGSITVFAVVILTFLFGCWKTRRSVLAIAPCLFFPYLWLLGAELAALQPREVISIWLLMPGLLAVFTLDPTSETQFQIVTAVATVLQFLIYVTLGRISIRWLVGTSVVVCWLSVWLSFFVGGLLGV